MQLKSLLATMAAVSLSALPLASADDGLIFYFPEANLNGQIRSAGVVSGTPAYCTQFQPIVSGRVNIRSYTASSINMLVYTNADCTGNVALLGGGGSTTNKTVTNADGLLSFQVVYNK